MSVPLIFALPGNEQMASKLVRETAGERGAMEIRSFPDSETYLRFRSEPAGRRVVLVCSLDRPDCKFLPLAFSALTAKDLGATSVGLVAPYLPYMRQDMRFLPGESLSAISFAGLLSHALDWLVTVDPHLHRYKRLDEVFPIRARVAHAAPLLAAWIESHAPDSVIIGPDSESQQWVSAVAERASVPYRVLRKERVGDRAVTIEFSDLGDVNDRVPILVDDIASTGHTMIEAAKQLVRQGFRRPICIAVHALLSDESFAQLTTIAEAVVSTNTVAHSSNRIDVAPILSRSLQEVLDE